MDLYVRVYSAVGQDASGFAIIIPICDFRGYIRPLLTHVAWWVMVCTHTRSGGRGSIMARTSRESFRHSWARLHSRPFLLIMVFFVFRSNRHFFSRYSFFLFKLAPFPFFASSELFDFLCVLILSFTLKTHLQSPSSCLQLKLLLWVWVVAIQGAPLGSQWLTARWSLSRIPPHKRFHRPRRALY